MNEINEYKAGYKDGYTDGYKSVFLEDYDSYDSSFGESWSSQEPLRKEYEECKFIKVSMSDALNMITKPLDKSGYRNGYYDGYDEGMKKSRDEN